MTKDYAKHLHSPAPGRYSPKYLRVQADPKEISLIGEKDKKRFNYEDRNNVHFVKEAEGQAAEAFDELNARCQRTVLNVLPPHLDPFKTNLNTERNKTIIAFAKGGEIESPKLRGGSKLGTGEHTPTRSPKMVDPSRSISLNSEEGKVSPGNQKKFNKRSSSEKPSATKLEKIPSKKNMQAISQSTSYQFLPGIDDLKFNSSYYIGQNP